MRTLSPLRTVSLGEMTVAVEFDSRCQGVLGLSLHGRSVETRNCSGLPTVRITTRNGADRRWCFHESPDPCFQRVGHRYTEARPTIEDHGLQVQVESHQDSEVGDGQWESEATCARGSRCASEANGQRDCWQDKRCSANDGYGYSRRRANADPESTRRRDMTRSCG